MLFLLLLLILRDEKIFEHRLHPNYLLSWLLYMELHRVFTSFLKS